jgi:hypothetical protein
VLTACFSSGKTGKVYLDDVAQQAREPSDFSCS